ncbi:MAG: NfeD family protein, partial [Pseudomonadota bacterium]
VIGAISLILAFFAFQTLPVNYAGILLILLSAVLFLLEIKIISHGLLGLAGIAALILGSVMLFSSGDASLRPATTLLVSTILTISVFFIAIAVLAIRAAGTRYQTGAAGLIGEIGMVKEWSGSRGRVFVHGEYWNAASDDFLGAGNDVEVISVDRLLLKVRKTRSS